MLLITSLSRCSCWLFIMGANINWNRWHSFIDYSNCIPFHWSQSKEECLFFSVLQGVYTATGLALLIILIGGFSINPILNAMNLEYDVRYVAKSYLVSISIGVIPLFIYNTLRSFIDALGKTKVSMFITLMTLPINLILNYLLIFGKLGFPEFGGIGAGIASAITYWIVTIIAIVFIHTQEPFTKFKVFHNLPRVTKSFF